MFPDHLQASIVLISSRDPDNSHFGTGFVVKRSRHATALVLTCAHVVEQLGAQTLLVDQQYPAQVLESGQAKELDLALLVVAGLSDRPCLDVSNQTPQVGNAFSAAGFQRYVLNDAQAEQRLQPLQGRFGQPAHVLATHRRIPIWELEVTGVTALQPGYSGSPVILAGTEQVVGIICQAALDGKTGTAIATSALTHLSHWHPVDAQAVREAIFKLGYRQQLRSFRRAVGQQAVGAFLIHGEFGYGQQWLLNRLIEQYVAPCLNGKTYIVRLNRSARRSGATALWRELGKQVGIFGAKPDPKAIATAIGQVWQTQPVLLVFHEIQYLPEAAFKRIIADFWLPLAETARTASHQGHPHKLLVFFLDYEGDVAQWNAPLVDKIDLGHYPLKTPRLSEFSDQELMNWLETECRQLPDTLTQDIDESVEDILETSDNGIPENVFNRICEDSGLDWHEVQAQWLRF